MLYEVITGAGAGNDELERILGGGDASLADDRDVMFATDLVDLVHLQQRHRLDRRTGEAALVVAE